VSEYVELPHGIEEDERDAWEAWLGNGNDDDTVDEFHDAYSGAWDSVGDFVREMIEDQDIADNISPYVDWDWMARDWQLSGDIWVERVNGVAHVFRGY
jgi:antirestriction protein